MNNILERLKAASCKVVKVEVPNIGDFYLKQLTFKEMMMFGDYLKKHPNAEHAPVLLSLSLCDEHGVGAVGIRHLDDVTKLASNVFSALIAAYNGLDHVQVDSEEENPSKPDPS